MKNYNKTNKENLKQFKDELAATFHCKSNVSHLMHELVTYIDQLLISIFHKNKLEEGNFFALAAIGSYGRRELVLHSDIDIILLHTEDIPITVLKQAQSFIQNCWDAGLNISHQITSVNQCALLAQNDLTVISSLLDLHLICGRQNLLEELQYYIHPLHMWNSHHYFAAKYHEQEVRHKKYGETAYNLEPNIKYGAGGLRDLQTLLCIGKRHYGIKKLAEGISCGLITDKEFEELKSCQQFLWRMRFGLHVVAEKAEERLLFDYQIKLAKLLGYVDSLQALAIEQLMKDYFKVIKRNRELTEMLLQWFSEAIVHHEKQRITPLDNYFQLSNDFIETKHPRIFLTHPQALMSIFTWIAKTPHIAGIRANTIRQIREHLYLINKKFRQHRPTTVYFLEIFQSSHPFIALQYMNRYGVLSHYLDAFAAVTGQMQYDLFHVYTVDQHSLFVIRNLERFLEPAYQREFPLAARLMIKLEKKDILYLAALFHDIAKGRGGDHSELGAIEARHFATCHHLSTEDSHLLTWLVKNHLLMSITAQRQDIYDPKTIQKFCYQLPSPHYLDYLYLLTVADICATNQKLWNSWKDSLLKELYQASHDFLLKQQALMDEKLLIQHKQEKALTYLSPHSFSTDEITHLWASFKAIYFLHEAPQTIALHTKAILSSKTYPVVSILPHHSEGGTEIFIYMPHHEQRFTITTTVLSNQHTTIQEAIVSACTNQFDLDIYIILDENQELLLNEQRMADIKNTLVKALSSRVGVPVERKKRLARTLAHFQIKPEVHFYDEDYLQQTRLFLIASDRPGLLACISRIFSQHQLALHSAKIATAGERVEDTFYLSNESYQPLNENQKELLKSAIYKELSMLNRRITP